MNKFHGFDVEWVIRSALTLWKDCETTANDGHFQYCE